MADSGDTPVDPIMSTIDSTSAVCGGGGATSGEPGGDPSTDIPADVDPIQGASDSASISGETALPTPVSAPTRLGGAPMGEVSTPAVVRETTGVGIGAAGGSGDIGDHLGTARHTDSAVPGVVGAAVADRGTVRHAESVVGGDQSTVAADRGPEAMEIDPLGTGVFPSDIAMSFSGIDVVVERAHTQESGSQAEGIPRDVLVEDVAGGSSTESEEVPLVRRIAPGPAIAIGTARVPEESAEIETEPSEPPLFTPAVGSSRGSGLTLADTLEGARDEDIAATLQEFPRFENVLVQEGMASIVRDAEQEERQREAEVAAGEERLTIVREVELSLDHRAPFTPATYVPRVHFFVPQGCDTYTPLLPTYLDTSVIRDRSTHIAYRNPLTQRSLGGYGGSAHSLEYYRALPSRVRALVDASGFTTFIRLLTVTRTDRKLIRALVERWWDTTNTFHFRFGEMTITPLDFAAITGLRVGGEPIPFDSELYLDHATIEHYLGRRLGGIDPGVRYTVLVGFWDHEPGSEEEARQMARAYLLYLFGASLFPNRQGMVHLGWLPALEDLETAGRFDWGGAGLCTVYCFLGCVCRGVGTSLGGYWRVLEVWAYEVLGVFAPANSHSNEDVLPRAEKWGSEYTGGGDHKGDLRTFRLFLDTTTGDRVRWNVWHRMRRDYLVRSRELTRSRVLLECPYGWRWYLGDRVSRQSLGIDHFRVPSPLPPLVQRTEEYTRAEIERYTVPTEVVFGLSIDYEGYLSTHLAYDLDMENRLRAGVALPELRREIEVVTADGALGVVTVPHITPTVTLATTEIPVEWAAASYQLAQDLQAMVRQFVMGMAPEVRPRAEPGVVLGRGRRATRGRAPARGVGEASRGRETGRGTRRRRESTSSERGASRGATPSAGAAEGASGSRRSTPRVTSVTPPSGRVLRSSERRRESVQQREEPAESSSTDDDPATPEEYRPRGSVPPKRPRT
ncbi:hypothetical protein Vadar_027471 [Vaccinium darrowii]|uniref:Uncharacterized protein n=1 Tax=Vaccinium darrowii TaxID=229202 RepID=A0ACB7ZGT9_9ERIC|nr:hypothetical protein Vadar_027471 [Vaccinium darrowii]